MSVPNPICNVAQVLSNCGVGNTIQISSEDAQDAQLSAADLRRLAGEGAITAATEIPRQRPGSPVPTTGVAFLLAGAGGIPGGPTLVSRSKRYGLFQLKPYPAYSTVRLHKDKVAT